jgi:signal peptide peptidase SppA
MKSLATRTLFAALFVCFSSPLLANAFNNSLEINTSQSQSYQSRNIFIHPAALGFESALNGTELSTSFAFASNPQQQNDLAFSAALSYFGLGVERLAVTGQTRYALGLGIPVSSQLFFGTRLSLSRFDFGTAYDSWGFGLQWRPNRWLAFSTFFDQVNQPLISGSASPILSVASITVRPLARLELSLDAATPSHQFLQSVSTQGTVAWSVAEGAKLRLGYHSTYQWSIGLQIHLGNTSLFSSIQPSSSARNAVVGFQSVMKPYRSSLSVPHAVKLSIGASLSQEKSAGNWFSPPKRSLLDLLQDLEALESDEGLTTAIIHLEEFPLGLASALEVHAAIQRLRKAGVETEVYLSNAGIKEYLVASAANRVYQEPEAEIRWLGLRSEKYFLKGTLDKLGVEGEFIAGGKYKSAPETFLRRESSPASKESTEAELQSLESTLRTVLETSRHIGKEKWEKLLKLGVLSSREALDENLIDGQESYASMIARREKTEWVLPPLPRRRDSLHLPGRVSVVVASGNILSGKNRFLSLSGTEQITPQSMEGKFREALADSRTKAIVFRIASPGGEVLASQQIATRVSDHAKSLPLFVSMGDVAASGGYFISAPAHRLFASPLTLTGSIGVFLGKFSFGGLYRFLDLKKEVTSSGPYPGLYSEDRRWSAEERAVMERRLGSYYRSFVSFVEKNRSISREEAEKGAQGRVWTGTQAKEKRLVDALGGYFEAIQAAAEKAGLQAGDYDVHEIESSVGLFDAWAENALSREWASPSTIPWSLFGNAGWARDLALFSTLRDSPFLYLAPYRMLD